MNRFRFSRKPNKIQQSIPNPFHPTQPTKRLGWWDPNTIHVRYKCQWSPKSPTSDGHFITLFGKLDRVGILRMTDIGARITRTIIYTFLNTRKSLGLESYRSTYFRFGNAFASIPHATTYSYNFFFNCYQSVGRNLSAGAPRIMYINHINYPANFWRHERTEGMLVF